MQIYKAPLNDYKFLIKNILDFSNYEYELSDLLMVIEEAAKISEEILLPINQSGDLEGCSFDKGIVKTPKGFKEAYNNFSQNGWQGIKVNEKYGGQNLPYFMNMILFPINNDNLYYMKYNYNYHHYIEQ